MHGNSNSWISDTLLLATKQNTIGNSPAEIVGGRLVLCAAACIAYAGLVRQNPLLGEKLKNEIKRTGSKQVVIDAFLSLGLSRDFCVHTMVLNDATSPANRIDILEEQMKSINTFTVC